MSSQNESDTSSPPILHFIKQPKSPDSPSAHNDDMKKSVENDDGEKPITTASHTRRVHFPVEDSKLRLISYPPEPFSNQPLVSLGVILQRYRATCLRLQLRPIAALLDQLNTMDDGRKSFFDRLDCLRIANEKIDLKHIDAIEEILSRCRFHTLDFEASTFEEPALTQLLDVLEYYESCTHINLSNNRSIGFQGYQALTKYLRKTRSLERLDVNSLRFDDNNVLSFTRSLRLSTTLYELHVESCQLNGKILQKFIQNLRLCSCLRELYLCDNRLQVQDSLYINELIRSCGQFLFLLDLRSNSIQDNGMSHIASQLSQYDENHTSGNNLHKISFQANQLTQQGVGFLAKSLLHNRTVRSINLSQNNITNEGLFLLRDALLTNRTINEIILRNCHLTDQAAIALAEFIAESSTIQYIDLRENNIQASGICGMAIAIKNNKSLLKLDFDPIVSTPTNINSVSSSNNIDRTTNTNSLLSLSNFRRMTTGFGSFTNSMPFNSNVGTGGGGGGTRELLEQKARWMNDIAAVCQRNILIYEENLRLQEREQQNTETYEQESRITNPEDIELEEMILDPLSVTTDTEHSASSIQNNSEDLQLSANGISQSVDDNNEVEQSKKNPVNDGKEIEQPLDVPVDGEYSVLTTPISNNHEGEQHSDTPSNDGDTVEQPILTPVNNNNETEQSAGTAVDSENNVEKATATPINDNHEAELPTTNPVEPVSNSNNEEQSKPTIIHPNGTLPESPSLTDPIEDIYDDDKRKIRHSDSLYLLRKKVKNEDDNTSDDESPISSSIEQ